MKRLALVSVLALSACPASRLERALRVVIDLDPGLTSKCLQVEVESGSSRFSDPLVLTGKTPLTAGVPQGDLPDTIRVRALGFLDERCTQRANEESDFATGTFEDGRIGEVNLRVSVRTPRTETRCGDAVDDDRDGLTDCADPDCTSQPCVASDRCLVEPRCASGTCQSTSVRQCRAPPTTCFLPGGFCVPSDGGCEYVVSTSNSCSDFDACTVSDACQADGGCEGTPLSCPMNTTQVCRSAAGACADGGCVYAVTPDAGCDDGEACTVDDRCSDQGACAGDRVVCAPRACAVFTGQCADGGTCLYAPVDAGTPCDGGVCSLAGDCLPPFPYAPSNFDVVQLRAPPPGPTVLDCGETIIDSTGPSVNRPTNWCNGQPYEATVIRQDGGVEALLVSFNGLSITHDGGLRLLGDKPVIFGVFGNVSITGTIVAEAGDRICAGESADGEARATGNGGGAGGSFSTVGGPGGTGSFTSGGTAPAIESNLGPSPLRGGCRGGRGGDQTNAPARGGGGFQISAAGTMTISNTIAAPGRGGSGGVAGAITRLASAGNGGGSGGLLVLEASALTVSGGALTANGGGGGEGAALAANGQSGAQGALTSASPAPGGSGMALGGGRGGDGAAGTTGATGGQNTITIGGGGGGGLGVVFLRSLAPCNLNPNAVYSPPANPDGGCS